MREYAQSLIELQPSIINRDKRIPDKYRLIPWLFPYRRVKSGV